MNRQKMIIAGGVTVMMAVVSVTAIYLPLYAADMDKLKEMRAAREAAGRASSRGSMWSNIDKQAKDP